MTRAATARPRVATGRAATLLLLLLLVLAAPAHASRTLQVGLEDEHIMLDTPDRAGPVARQWAKLGVDVMRVHARWRDRNNLGALDHAVNAAADAGLRVELTITGRVRRPDPRTYARFAARVAARYRGRVARYLIWNEPNIKGWLWPQARCTRSRPPHCVPVSPHLYRALVRAAVPAVHAADPGTPVLIGELAPIGGPLDSSQSTVAPLPFLRAFACVDAAYRPLTRGRCRHFRPAAADGIGHHPHGQRASPTHVSADPDWAKIADLSRLEAVLDRLTTAHRILAPDDRFDLWLTEFGYQTNPPDRDDGITLGHQAAWLQLAAYRAWRDPRIRSLTLYEWEDEPTYERNPGGSPFAGWQSGLRFADGRPKPALRGVRVPFVVDRDRERVWGQVRPGAAHTVTLQRRRGAGWSAIGGPIATDTHGAFLMPMALRTGERLRYVTESGDHSGSVAVPAAGVAAPRR